MAGDGASDRGAAEVVRGALAGSPFARVTWVGETGSTNADVLAAARQGAPEGTVVVADHQSAGRGRRSRTWVAPPGGSLLVSVLLRPPAAVAAAATTAAAVAMSEAVELVTGVAPGLKWPNDLVIADRKLAGILAEADWPAGSEISAGWRESAPTERVPVVVGVGVNVAWPAPLPPELAAVADTAIALDRLPGAAPPPPGASADARVDLLIAFLRRLGEHYGPLVTTRSAAAVLDEWRRRSATLGRRVRVDLGAEEVEGTAVDVTAEGHLVVETGGGRRTLAVGDVVHLRPTD